MCNGVKKVEIQKINLSDPQPIIDESKQKNIKNYIKRIATLNQSNTGGNPYSKIKSRKTKKSKKSKKSRKNRK
jgi:hypothetical protein